jgi:hypothetical protein
MTKSILSFILGATIVSGIIFTCGSFVTEPDCDKCISEYLKNLNRQYDTVQTLMGTRFDVQGLNPIEKKLLQFESRRIEYSEAAKLNRNFASATNFRIPCAWTFDAVDVRAVVRTDDSLVKRIRLYAAIDSTNTMTLIMLGMNKNDRDITEVNNKSVLIEYADPCPPKCGTADPNLLTRCIFKTVSGAKDQAAECTGKLPEVTIEDWRKKNRK